MNTNKKAVIIRECQECPDNYMTVGEEKILLSQHRPATGPHGICPKHRRNHGTAPVLA